MGVSDVHIILVSKPPTLTQSGHPSGINKMSTNKSQE